jgi:predicted MFS family arabinose efflux permease
MREMFRNAFAFYFDSFSGLSRDVWILGMITLINRSGAMVIPFLTVYMTQELGFSKPQAGFAMSCFGIGSLIGTFLGGQLTDRKGFYPVQFWSLVLTGLCFLGLMQIKAFMLFCLAVFTISVVAEAFRPANFAAIAAYAYPTNLTRSYSLIRLAINLGFAIGPAFGGWLAHGLGYDWLFIVDGVTCLIAAFTFRILLRPKKEGVSAAQDKGTAVSGRFGAYSDRTFLWFMLCMVATAISFMQFFSVVPVYFREYFEFNEGQIGVLLAINGLIIAFLEMPLVYRIEGRCSKYVLVAAGALLMGASFLTYNFLPAVWGVAVLAVVLVTLGEMLNFPFSNAIALERSNASNRGQYMGAYSMAFSLAHILSPSIGMQVANYYGFGTLWFLTAGIAAAAALGFLALWNRKTNTYPV